MGVYTLAGIPVGWLADRYNRKLIFVVSLLFWSACTAAMGASQTFWQLLLARAGQGLGQAGCNPTANGIMAELFVPEASATARGVYSTAIYLGYSLAFSAAGPISSHFGFRAVYYVFGLVGLSILFTVREPKRGVHDSKKSEAAAVAAEVGEVASKPSLLSHPPLPPPLPPPLVPCGRRPERCWLRLGLQHRELFRERPRPVQGRDRRLHGVDPPGGRLSRRCLWRVCRRLGPQGARARGAHLGPCRLPAGGCPVLRRRPPPPSPLRLPLPPPCQHHRRALGRRHSCRRLFPPPHCHAGRRRRRLLFHHRQHRRPCSPRCPPPLHPLSLAPHRPPLYVPGPLRPLLSPLLCHPHLALTRSPQSSSRRCPRVCPPHPSTRRSQLQPTITQPL